MPYEQSPSPSAENWGQNSNLLAHIPLRIFADLLRTLRCSPSSIRSQISRYRDKCGGRDGYWEGKNWSKVKRYAK